MSYTLSPSTTRVGEPAHRAGNLPWIDWLARLGLLARAIVYVLVGYLAVQIAIGHQSQQASKTGAFQTIAEKPFGTPLLVAMAIGFFGYALWRLTEAIWGHRTEDGAKRWAKRGYSLGRAALYTAFGYSALRLVAGSGGGSGSGGAGGAGGGGSNAPMTARLLKTSFGQPLVVIIGLVVIGVGIGMAVRGARTKFEKHLRTGEMSHRTRKVVEGLGTAGMVARGVVFTLIGIFLVQAAATFDPQKARGLDGSLRELAQHSWGKVALFFVAAGLAAFGLYSAAEARYRRTGQESGGHPGR